jgi:hypothetical protein
MTHFSIFLETSHLTTKLDIFSIHYLCVAFQANGTAFPGMLTPPSLASLVPVANSKPSLMDSAKSDHNDEDEEEEEIDDDEEEVLKIDA